MTTATLEQTVAETITSTILASRSALVAALVRVKRFAGAKGLAILEWLPGRGLCVRVGDGGRCLYDSAWKSVEVEDSGECAGLDQMGVAVGVGEAHKILSALDAESVRIEREFSRSRDANGMETTEETVSVVAGRYRLTLPEIAGSSAAIHSDAIPEAKRLDGAQAGAILPLAELVAMAKRTAVSISREDSRFQLLGASLEITDGEVRLTGTDGHRLHTTTAPAQTMDRGECSLIVPASVVDTLAKLPAKEQSGDAFVTISEERGDIRTDTGAEYWFRGLDGQFPDWRKVFDQADADTFATVDVAELSKACGLVRKLRGRSGGQAVRLAVAADALTFETHGDGASVEAQIPATFRGDSAAESFIGLDAEYLADALAFCGERAELHWQHDGRRQLIVQTATSRLPDGHTFEALVMPIDLGRKG